MEIIQKKLLTKYVFTFKDEQLHFSSKNKNGKKSIELNYSDFPSETSAIRKKDDRFLGYGFGFFLLGAFQIGYALYSGSNAPMMGWIWLALALPCIIYTHCSKTLYTTFDTDRNTIYIIRDKNHDMIVNELYSRRKKQKLDWYGEIDLKNDLDSEIRKFLAFHNEGIITQEELDKKVAQLEILKQERAKEHA